MTKGQFLTWTKVVISASLALGSIAPANAQSWTNCPAASPFDTVPDNVPLQQCVDNYDIVALSPGGQGYILDAIDGNPDTGLRIERYGLTLTSSQIPDKVLIKAGLTLVRCTGGSVHDNFFEENTDIDLVVANGAACEVKFNTIRHWGRYGFAGLHVAKFEQSDNHAGSRYRNNDIYSEPDRLAFGLIVGMHPWNSGLTLADGGSVEYNSISGAVVNLAVDGIDAGTLVGNSTSNARGSRGFNCNIPANYTIGHYGWASLQPAWDGERYYHDGGCVP